MTRSAAAASAVVFLSVLCAGCNGPRQDSDATQPASRPLSQAEQATLDRDTKDAATLVRDLRSMAHLDTDLDKATVWTSHWGGIPGTNMQSAAVAYRDTAQHWRIEYVRRAEVPGTPGFGPVQVTHAILKPVQADQLETLLSENALYGEPSMSPANCTDAGQTTLSVTYNGRSHVVVSEGCPGGATEKVLGIIDGAESPAL